MTIKIEGNRFIDEAGRTLHLRGVNLSGSSKVPTRPDGATHRREGFFEHRDVSFVGRPFPLEEADEHFARLQSWGMDFLRFLVTWEAIEHAGPGQYDEAYLDYVHAVLSRAREHGLRAFVDPHQDVWSRFTGGDGAPGWTLEAVGFDLANLHATGAAFLHQLHGDPLPRMTWFANYSRLACATMFTLFFGGRDFAPATLIEGQNAQDYLQAHYFGALQALAERLRDLDNVVGYGSMNEPHNGYIGLADIQRLTTTLRNGVVPTPYQGMLLGEGLPQEVERWAVTPLGFRKMGVESVDPQGLRAWQAGRQDVWLANGVWELKDDQQAILRRPAHFYRVHSGAVSFANDYLKPFLNDYAAAIREADPDAMIFIEADVTGEPPQWGPEDAANIVYAPHWYDALTLISKRYFPLATFHAKTARPIVGAQNVKRSFEEQLKTRREEADGAMGGVPVLIGEIGIPFDLNEKRAYKTGDFRAQIRAANASLNALEANLLSYTWWNYTPDNTNERGDQWNDEDLSLFSRDQQSDPDDVNSGGRALQAMVRPYAWATAGIPTRQRFDIDTGVFEFAFSHDDALDPAEAPTEIVVPAYCYPEGYRVEITDGEYEIDHERGVLLYRHETRRRLHTVRLLPSQPRMSRRTGSFRPVLVLLLALVVVIGFRQGQRRRQSGHKQK